jgi:hypothetical protein
MKAHNLDGSSESEDCLDVDDGICNKDLVAPLDGDLFGTAEDYNSDDFGQDMDSEDEESEGTPEKEIQAAEWHLVEL